MMDLAPLLDIPEAPIPDHGEAAWVMGAGGAKLRAALFQPPGQLRGSIVISGGRTEPIEKYYELIAELQARGFVVLIHDWRGQGLSVRELGDRLKGHANGAKPYLEDFQRLLNAYQDRLPKPWIALGHSMGGALTLLALAEGESRFAAAILSAPMLGVRTAPASLGAARWATWMNTAFGGRRRYMSRQAARFVASGFEGNVLTHDPVRFARHQAQLAANPDLALGAPTWGWLDFALRACAYLAKPERLGRITLPVTIVSAGDERLVENAAQAAAARHLPQGRLIVVPGAYHEILMERDDMRNIFMKALDALLGRSAPAPAKPPQPVAAAAPAPKPAPAPTPAPAPAAAPVAAAPKPVVAPAVKKAAPRVAAQPRAAAKKTVAKTAAPKTKPVAAKAKPPAVKKPTAAKAAPAKAAAPNAAAKPAAPKAVKKPVAKAPAVKKPPVAKPAAAKAAPVARKAPARKAPAKPAVAKAPVAIKKPAARKPAARKPAPKKA